MWCALNSLSRPDSTVVVCAGRNWAALGSPFFLSCSSCNIHSGRGMRCYSQILPINIGAKHFASHLALSLSIDSNGKTGVGPTIAIGNLLKLPSRRTAISRKFSKLCGIHTLNKVQ